MTNHYQETATFDASPKEIFAIADDHMKLGSHMNQTNWMMGGGSMKTEIDTNRGQKVGSHIKMAGKVFGIYLFLDEVIVERDPPKRKSWKTVGKLNLLVIGHYQLGFDIEARGSQSLFTVFINYDLPTKNRWLGKLFGRSYAKWCVRQMIKSVRLYTNTI